MTERKIHWTDYRATQERAVRKHIRRLEREKENANKPFLDYEDNILRRFWPDEGDMVNKRLSRPNYAIHRRVKQLGLVRKHPVNEWDLSQSVVPMFDAWLRHHA